MHERDLLAAPGLHGQVERVSHDALDAVARVDRLLHRHLVLGPLPVEAAGARVQALGVLTNDDEVHVLFRVTGHQRLNPRVANHGAQVDVLVQLEPDLQQQVALEDPGSDTWIAHGPQEDGVHLPQPVQLLIGKNLVGP